MRKLLVADDNAASRELLRYLLRADGREIVQAADGAQALAAIEACMPDLVLLDIQMPVVDGYAVIERLRRDPRFTKLPVIAVTARAMVGEREKALRAGFDEYVTKPIEGRELRNAVTKLLGERHG